VKALVMDPNGAWVIGQDLDGVLGAEKIFRQPQNHRWFNGPTRELETAVIERRVTHDGNGWPAGASTPCGWTRTVQERAAGEGEERPHRRGHMPFALADQAAAAPPPKPSYDAAGSGRSNRRRPGRACRPAAEARSVTYEPRPAGRVPPEP
jgi:hypothetical protein